MGTVTISTTTLSRQVAAGGRRRAARPSAIHALAVRIGLALAHWGRGGRPDRDRARREFDRLEQAEARRRDSQAYGLMHR